MAPGEGGAHGGSPGRGPRGICGSCGDESSLFLRVFFSRLCFLYVATSEARNRRSETIRLGAERSSAWEPCFRFQSKLCLHMRYAVTLTCCWRLITNLTEVVFAVLGTFPFGRGT